MVKHERRRPHKTVSEKTLLLSDNKVLLGVCAGIAEYYDLDPTIVRLIWALATLIGGSGGLLYIFAAVFMDEAPSRN